MGIEKVQSAARCVCDSEKFLTSTALWHLFPGFCVLWGRSEVGCFVDVASMVAL
jgi:hypothetical protein